MGQDWQYWIPFYGQGKLAHDVGKDVFDKSKDTNTKAKDIGEKYLGSSPLFVPTKQSFKVLNEVKDMWTGDKNKLSEIEKKIAESGQNPYNTMKAETIPVTQELRDYYQQMKRAYEDSVYQAKQGMTPAETAAYQNQFNQQQNLAAQTAQMAGGGGAGAYINSVLGGQAAGFNVKMAAQNQAIKRQNQQLAYSYLQGLGGAAGQMQDVSTRQAMLNQDAFSKNFEKQMMVEQALGQAKQDWYSNRDANRQGIISAYTNLLGAAIGMGGGGGGGAVAAKSLTGGSGGGSYYSSPSYKSTIKPYNPDIIG